VTCAGVALLQVAIGLVARHARRPRWSIVPRRAAVAATAAGTVAALAVALALGGGGALEREWQNFRQLPVNGANAGDTVVARFGTLSGNGRYQLWQAADRAHDSAPVHGIGSGTFEYWWARTSDLNGGGFVRDAHSLYLETWGELGLVGSALLGGLLALVLAMGVAGSLRAKHESQRLGVAAATATALTFAAVAAVEWVWEIAVIPVVLLLVAGVILARPPERAARPIVSRIVLRIGLAALAVAAIVVIAIPLVSTSAVRESQVLAGRDELGPALAQARTATELMPYSATALLQQALILERAGDLPGAQGLVERAVEAEPTNWRPWLIASRIAAERGQAARAVADYRRARALNPNSLLLRRR
jgi:hypothetical protein